MTHPMPTPEELEAEALELEMRATTKDRIADYGQASPFSANLLRVDASIFREEAASKRAKAERMRKAVTT